MLEDLKHILLSNNEVVSARARHTPWQRTWLPRNESFLIPVHTVWREPWLDIQNPSTALSAFVSFLSWVYYGPTCVLHIYLFNTCQCGWKTFLTHEWMDPRSQACVTYTHTPHLQNIINHIFAPICVIFIQYKLYHVIYYNTYFIIPIFMAQISI